MRAIPPLNALHFHKAKEGFVHKGGRLQGVAPTLARHVAPGDPLQLGVDQRGQLFQRNLITGAPST
jgi:hypothetical protein